LIQQLKRTAPDLSEHKALELLSDWRQRAQERRESCTQREAAQLEMTPHERKALHSLYAAHVEEIDAVCARMAEQAEDRATEKDDLLSESWEVFRAALVDYDPERASLSTYVQIAMRSRLSDLVKTQRATTELEDAVPGQEQTELEDDEHRPALPPSLNLDEIAERVIEERSPREHQRLREVWERLSQH
jgi:hypothetical protein